MPNQSASAMLDASVVICTHNPRPDYFARVLDGLRNQTLPSHRWELLIVDNASHVPLASSCDISWHPFGRHLWERELGVAYARRRGIKEASADLIIFVDDDNVLGENYLVEAIKIGQEWPPLGAWGSGCIRGDFEVEPPVSLTKLRPWWLIPVREVPAPRWSNVASCEEAIPWCAGLCLRKEVGLAYNQLFDRSSIKITSRQGAHLFGGEDIEISFVSCSRGLGVGIFPQMKLTHLIPKCRLSKDYLVRMMEDSSLSGLLLSYKWQQTLPQSPFNIKMLLSVLKTILLYRGVYRDIRFAWMRALIRANRIIQTDLRKNKRLIASGQAGLPRE
jgi:glycosyltransferase involved in cell wall biosynthesis